MNHCWSCFSLPTADVGSREDTGTPVGDDNVSCCGAPSLHKTRKTSVGLEELQHLFLHKRPLYILLNILRATKSSAVCSVRACMWGGASWVKASRQTEEQSPAETPALETKPTVSPASFNRGQHCFARLASLDITLRFWCFCVVCVGILSEQRSYTRAPICEHMGHRPGWFISVRSYKQSFNHSFFFFYLRRTSTSLI